MTRAAGSRDAAESQDPAEVPGPAERQVRRWDGRRALIAGGRGFLGSHLAVRLDGWGARVHVLDLADASRPGCPDLPSGAIPFRADVRDAGVLAEALAGVSAVFDLVGLRGHAASMEDPLADLEANCAAHLSLLEACRHRPEPPRVVFASSRQVYGPMRTEPVTESHPVVPVDVQGVHKRAVEEYLRLYHAVHGLPAVALRFSNVYGPGMDLDPRRGGFLATWISLLRAGRPLPVWGDGAERRDLLYIDDACDALLAAAVPGAPDTGVFNIAGPEPASFTRIAAVLLSAAGRGEWCPTPADPVQARIALGDFVLDGTLARTTLGFEARVGTEEGLRRTWARLTAGT